MSRCEKLLKLARRNPVGLRFTELCILAECHEWEFVRQRGSHRIYKRDAEQRTMVFHEGRNGAARPYEVRQLLETIEPVLKVSQ